MKAPKFWNKRGLLAWLLYPLSLIYSRISHARFSKPPHYKAHVPVLCIGNLVVGGAGKTPTALTLGRTALELGLTPVFLTRGFKGQEEGPVMVDPKRHRVADIGDEPLLLARTAPTIVAKDRVKGVKMAEEMLKDKEGAIVIMDDGFQNPYLHKDFNLVVVDAKHSIGNGFVLPAGPLRLGLLPQVRRADLFLVVGEGERAPRLRQLAAKLGKASNHAHITPTHCSLLGGTRVFAFCGIGQPRKFHKTLDELELVVVDSKDFSDHHAYSEADAVEIIERAEQQNLAIVTTAKDHVRLLGNGNWCERLAREASIVEVDMLFDDRGFPRLVLDQTLRKFSRR